MAMTTAAVVGNIKLGRKKFTDKKHVHKHGDESHTGGSGKGGSENEMASIDAPELENSAVTFKNNKTMETPAKNMKDGAYAHSFESGYKPYSMPATKYGNSPITKNFGTTIDRGFNVDYKEADAGVGSGLNYAAVGSSPAKWGWLKKVGKVAGKIMDPLGIRKKVLGAGKNLLGKLTGARPHTHDESGNVVQGEAEGGGEAAAAPEAFSAMSKDDYMGMDAAGRKEYMGGLSGDDRAAQMAAFNA